MPLLPVVVSGVVFEFIKAHDVACHHASINSGVENSAHMPFFCLAPHRPPPFPHGFLPSRRSHLTLLNPLNRVSHGLLHATAVSKRGLISVIVKEEKLSHQPYIIYSHQA